MARIVLTADHTLMGDYWEIPLLSFAGCVPVNFIPSFIFNLIERPIPHEHGRAKQSPYGLRKVEAALLKGGYRREDVLVAHPWHLDYAIDDDTRIIGVHAMDPMGFGPVTMMFTHGGKYTPYTKKRFMELIDTINGLRNGKSKLVVGGPGAWQIAHLDGMAERLKIDHVIMGEVEHRICEIFSKIEEGDLPEVVRIRDAPRVDQIPEIVGPSLHGLVEAMRGCGRNCRFCDPNMRRARHIPLDKILREVRVNASNGVGNCWLHSEDIFLYGFEDSRHLYPNRDAVLELFRRIRNEKGVTHTNPTHGTVAPVVADPILLKKASEILRASPTDWIGIQPGMETGSPKLIKRYMERKCLPFSPEEWQEIMIEGTRIFNENYWFPAYTLIVGLPGETEDDAWETVRLLNRLEKLDDVLGPKSHFTTSPLAFIPMGALTGEEFFDVKEMMNEARFQIIYKSFRRVVKEFIRSPMIMPKMNPFLKLLFRVAGKLGMEYMLRAIERWGMKLGYDPDKAKDYSFL